MNISCNYKKKGKKNFITMPYSSLIVILTKMRCRRCKTFTPNKNKKKIENNGNTDIQSTLILCGNEESVKKVKEQKTKHWRLSNAMPSLHYMMQMDSKTRNSVLCSLAMKGPHLHALCYLCPCSTNEYLFELSSLAYWGIHTLHCLHLIGHMLNVYSHTNR